MKVHDSALRHGVLPEDAVQAVNWPLWVEPIGDEDWPHSELRLGFDTQARLLETVVIFESGDEMVIHATPCRPASSTGICCPEPVRSRPARSLVTRNIASTDLHPVIDLALAVADRPAWDLLAFVQCRCTRCPPTSTRRPGMATSTAAALFAVSQLVPNSGAEATACPQASSGEVCSGGMYSDTCVPPSVRDRSAAHPP